ncbi:MAG: RNA methyltransferase [Kiritimatiellia bacterium]
MPRLDRIRIVLVNPLYGGNVGSVCRAMANTGLSELVVVAPPGLDMEEARKMAVGAKPILEARREVATLAEAVADCGLVMGATARLGLYRQHAASPREVAPRALEEAEKGPVALVFGREDKGLFNEEIALCTHLIRIPSHPNYVSLNLAQAVMVCAYELFVASGTFEAPLEKSGEAPAGLRERLFGIWRETLLDIGFMDEDKADHMMLGLRRVWSRGKMTVDDVTILMGIARQMKWRARHPDRGSAESGPDSSP